MFLTPFQPIVAVEDLTPTPGAEPENSELQPFVDESEPEAGAGTGDEPGEGDTVVVVADTDDETPDADVIDDLDDEVDATESLQQQIEHLTNVAGAIEQYGISPGLMLVADREGLLSNAFPVIPATETLAGQYKPDSATSTGALEGVLEAIKSKVSEMAAKAASATRSVATKGAHLVTRAASVAGDIAHRVASVTWDAAKDGARKVKAHPYKTIAAVLLAIGAVAGIVALVWGFPAAPAGVAGWFGKIKTAVGALKYPFGGVKTSMEGERLLLTWEHADGAAASAVKDGSLGALGWSKATLTGGAKTLAGALSKVGSAIAGLSGKVLKPGAAWVAKGADKAADAAGAAVRGGGRLGERVGGEIGKRTSIGAGIGGEFGKAFGESFTFALILSYAVKLTWMLLRYVVLGGYQRVRASVVAVARVVSGHREEVAEA